MFDAIGGSGAGKEFRERLEAAGVQINAFNKVEDPRIWRINRRSHRKLLVVDGRIAFTGGINIMDDMEDISNGGYPVAFGNFSMGYIIVDRIGIRTLRDPYSAKPYVEFYSTKRVGGGLYKSEAIKLIKTEA